MVVREEDISSIMVMVVAVLRKLLVMCNMGTVVEDGACPSLMEIGWPIDVCHIAHVTFDHFGGFLDLPMEFEPEVPQSVPSARSDSISKKKREEEGGVEEGANDNDDDGGAFAGGGILGVGVVNEHLDWLEDLHLVKEGGTVISDDDLIGGGGDHLVHAFWG